MQSESARGRAETGVSNAESPFSDASSPLHYQPNDSGSGSESDLDSEVEQKLEKSKRPPENNFSQQRLAAVNPVFSARTMIPLLIALGAILVPLGVGLWYASEQIQDISIQYTQCEFEANSDYWTPIPWDYVTYQVKNTSQIPQPMWKLKKDLSYQWPEEQNVCEIQFDVPVELKGPLHFFYNLKNFYQNHRRYAKSFSEDQILGTAASADVVENTAGINCEPLALDPSGKIIYPCGLIANSLFNDTYSSVFLGVNGTDQNYTMTNKGIAWSTNHNRYKKTKYNYTQIVPPPNWIKMFPDGYNATNVPDILQWEEFQNWMYTSAFADFRKLALQNTQQSMPAGTYQVDIGLHFPVVPYKGEKYFLLSQSNLIGGKNPFLGFLWIATGGVCLLLGIFVLIMNIVRPRKAGDVNMLSWNREAFKRDEQ